MTTATKTYDWSTNTVTAIRGWIEGTRDLILEAGLTQASDSGQLDPAAIAGGTAGASSVNHGYMVFRFPGALGASRPVFLKLSFHHDSEKRAQIKAEVSTSTDGNGVPSSGTSFKCETGPYYNLGQGVVLPTGGTSYACYVDGYFGMVLGYGNGGSFANPSYQDHNCVLNLVIERARNSDGSTYNDGLLVEGASQTFYSNGASSRCIMYGGGSPAQNNFIPALIPSFAATTTADGPNVNVFRHYSMVPGVHPQTGMLTYLLTEIGPLTPFTVPVLGQNRTYLPVGYAMNQWSARPSATHACAIRWE